MNNLITFPPPDADKHARAETQRKQSLFAWADRVLAELGVARRVQGASTLDELRLVTFDADAAEVVLAIRDALHPASGGKEAHFAGLTAGVLKRVLISRFRKQKNIVTRSCVPVSPLSPAPGPMSCNSMARAASCRCSPT